MPNKINHRSNLHGGNKRRSSKANKRGVAVGVILEATEEYVKSKHESQKIPTPLSRAEKHRKKLSRIVMGILSGAGLLTLIQIAIPAPVDQWIMDQKIESVDVRHVIETMNKTKGATYGIVSISGPVEYNAATMSIPVTGLHDGHTHYNCTTRQFTQYIANIWRLGSFVPEVSCGPGIKTEWIAGSKS